MITKIIISIIFLQLIFLHYPVFAQSHDFENQFRLAKSFESRGQLEAAQEIYYELHSKFPGNYQFYSNLFKNLIAQKKYNDALELVENQLLLDDRSVVLYGDKGTVLYLQGDEKAALEIWEKALEIEPENAFAYRSIADYLVQNRLLEEAIEVLKKGNSVSKDPTIFSYDIANFYSISMNYEKAAEEYCKILERKPKQINLVQNRILGYINSDLAEKPTLETIEKAYRSNESIVFLQLLMELYTLTDKGEKALKAAIIIEEETSRNGSALFAFAQRATLFQNYEVAAEAYKEIINSYPSSALYAQAEIGYSRSLELNINSISNQGDSWKPIVINDRIDTLMYTDLLSAYDNLSKKYSNNEIGWEAEFRMARIYQKRFNNYAKADSIYRKILDEGRSLQYINDANFGIAEIAIKNGNLEESENYLSKVLLSKLSNADLKLKSNFLMAKCKMWKGNFSESVEYFSTITENPKDKFVNDALQYLLIINTMKNDSLNLLSFIKSDYLIEKNDFEQAIAQLKIISENSELFILKDIAALKYAELLIALNRYQEAGMLLEELSNCDEGNIYEDRFLYLLGSNYYFGLNDQKKAIGPLNKILTDYQNSIYQNKARQIISEINLGVDNNL